MSTNESKKRRAGTRSHPRRTRQLDDFHPAEPLVPPQLQPSALELIHFEQTCELLRHHSALRLRQLTVFVAVNGGLLLALFRFGGSLAGWQLAAAAAVGVIAALAFAMLEIRLNFYVDHYRRVVSSYEERFGLNYHLFAPELRGLFFRGRLAVLLFIASAVSAWLLALALVFGI